MNIFLDLDGTLIDPSARLYALFARLSVQVSGCTELAIPSFSTYWQLKRDAVNQMSILKLLYSFDDDTCQRFKSLWMCHIEDPDLLLLDKPFPGIQHALSVASRRHSLHIITARQNPDRVFDQLNSYKLLGVFSSVLVTKQSTTKAKCISSSLTVSPSDVLVGDTRDDILAAKELGIRSVAVDSGFLKSDHLAKYSPCYLLNFASEFLLNTEQVLCD